MSPTGRALVAAGSVMALIGTFLPWLASGSVDRSSYDLIDLIERLGFSSDGPVGIGIRAWPIVPLLYVVSVVLVWQAVPVPTAARLGWWGVSAAYPGATALAVLAAPDAALLSVRYGVLVTLAGVAALVAGAITIGVASVRSRADRRGDQ